MQLSKKKKLLLEKIIFFDNNKIIFYKKKFQFVRYLSHDLLILGKRIICVFFFN